MLPPETILAAFPHSANVAIALAPCKRVLRLEPMTLAHAIALEAWGCDLGKELDDAHALIAAWFLVKPASVLQEVMSDINTAGEEAQKWIREKNKCVARIATAVNRHIASAFGTFVPPASESEQLYENSPRGYGWPLEVAEALCGEYGWKFGDALATPVATALALVSVARQRNGGKAGGPDYYERIQIAEMKKAGVA